MNQAGTRRRRGRRPAGFCQEQTLVLTEQLSSMKCGDFHDPYLSDKIPEAAFHGQAVKTVAYLRTSTAQQDVRSQRLAILEYARKHDFRIDDFIEVTAAGQASEKRRRLDELMNVLQRGDRLVVSEPLPAWSVAGSDRRHPRRHRQGRRRLRGDEREHPRRWQAQHPDQGHDHALRVVRRGRARPDLRAHPRELCASSPTAQMVLNPAASTPMSRPPAPANRLNARCFMRALLTACQVGAIKNNLITASVPPV